METKVKGSYLFIFQDDAILLFHDKGQYRIPYLPMDAFSIDNWLEVSTTIDNEKSFTAAVDNTFPVPKDFTFFKLRTSFRFLTSEEYKAAGKAYQIIYWDKNSRFCPVCCTSTQLATPICKRCPACGKELYPPISPAIIVLIMKDDQILLVHARNFRGTFYGLVAGFLEAGETLEECVQREVREETGLEIKNLRYWGNQPWPYPSGLMLGFTAEYAGGNIKLQDDELSAGAFYSKDNLPEIPEKLSLARKLIDWWLAQQ